VKRIAFALLSAALMQGCASLPDAGPAAAADYAPAYPEAAYAIEREPGTIYSSGSFDLFMDLRARAVGDTITILLVERTAASKESSTSTSKGTSVDTGFPIFAGRPITSDGTPILNNEIGTDSSFSGAADSSQSNRLDGSITVTVAGRLPNGNLLVRGEKLITLNQGEEFIRVEGILRPIDIGPQNVSFPNCLFDSLDIGQFLGVNDALQAMGNWLPQGIRGLI
jgi:flagellar L-ring protein precursor FlgH